MVLDIILDVPCRTALSDGLTHSSALVHHSSIRGGAIAHPTVSSRCARLALGLFAQSVNEAIDVATDRFTGA